MNPIKIINDNISGVASAKRVGEREAERGEVLDKISWEEWGRLHKTIEFLRILRERRLDILEGLSRAAYGGELVPEFMKARLVEVQTIENIIAITTGEQVWTK